MNYLELETPALIIDQEIMLANIERMQDYADEKKVFLRPHTKTHKMPEIAKIQMAMGAKGIAVAKTGEAEVMAKNGLSDIFIANEIVAKNKLERIKKLAREIEISFGLDSVAQAEIVEEVFAGEEKKAQVLIEIEVGENRSGVIEEKDFLDIIEFIKNSKNIHLKGLFSHDGNSYKAENIDECREIHLRTQERTLKFKKIAEDEGLKIETVSIGSTPSLIHDFPILDGVTEIRPGTYIFMDAAQGLAAGTFEMNAASIISTVISLPTEDRIITDVGAKGLTMQQRTKGFTKTRGLGLIKGHPDDCIDSVFDEHAIIYSKKLHDELKVGDVLEFIPNHICPVVNLYDNAYLVQNGEVVEEIKIECRGKLT